MFDDTHIKLRSPSIVAMRAHWFLVTLLASATPVAQPALARSNTLEKRSLGLDIAAGVLQMVVDGLNSGGLAIAAQGVQIGLDVVRSINNSTQSPASLNNEDIMKRISDLVSSASSNPSLPL
jgi:hypothetical protein